MTPRPSDGLVHAHESPTATTPVATGRPSTTKFAVAVLDLGHDLTMPSSMGSPSSQWAARGRLAPTASSVSTSRRPRMAAIARRWR